MDFVLQILIALFHLLQVLEIFYTTLVALNSWSSFVHRLFQDEFLMNFSAYRRCQILIFVARIFCPQIGCGMVRIHSSITASRIRCLMFSDALFSSLKWHLILQTMFGLLLCYGNTASCRVIFNLRTCSPTLKAEWEQKFTSHQQPRSC